MDSATLAELLYEFAHDLRAPERALDGFSRALFEDMGRELSASCARYLDRITQNAARLQQHAEWLGRLAAALRPPRVNSAGPIGPVFAEAAADLNARGGLLRVELNLSDEYTVDWDIRHLRLLVHTLHAYGTCLLGGRPGVVRISQHASNPRRIFRVSTESSLPDSAVASCSQAAIDRTVNLELGIIRTVFSHYAGACLNLLGPAQLEIDFGGPETPAEPWRLRLQPGETLGATVSESERPSESVPATATKSLGKILVIDDDPADIELFQAALEDRMPTQQTHFCPDPWQALSKLRDLANTGQAHLLPHVVFVDLRMPRCNGLEIVRAIKSEPPLSLVPVVILSSSTSHVDVQAAYAAGANAFVAKPAEFRRFAEVIRCATWFWSNCNRRAVE